MPGGKHPGTSVGEQLEGKMDQTPQQQTLIERQNRYYLFWTVLFGVCLALGGTALEPVPLPLLPVTGVSLLVPIVITLNKLLLMRRFSITWMYVVASLIAIFTVYLGPPSPAKPIFILAGLSFDLATGLRTRTINLPLLFLGHLVITVVGFLAFWVTLAIYMEPAGRSVLAKLLLFAAPAHFVVSMIMTTVVYYAVKPWAPPAYVKRVWATVGAGK